MFAEYSVTPMPTVMAHKVLTTKSDVTLNLLIINKRIKWSNKIEKFNIEKQTNLNTFSFKVIRKNL